MLMASPSHRSPLTATQIVDEYFIENTDFRLKALAEALDAISAPGERLTRIQHVLSDPTTAPLDALDRKSARGAYERAKKTEARS
jgi:hypothetical protein